MNKPVLLLPLRAQNGFRDKLHKTFKLVLIMLSKSRQKLAGQKIMANFAAVSITKPFDTKISPSIKSLLEKRTDGFEYRETRGKSKT